MCGWCIGSRLFGSDHTLDRVVSGLFFMAQTINKRNLNFTLNILDKDGEPIARRTTHRLLCFKDFLNCATLKKDEKYYLKVFYGNHEDVYGNMAEFSNEGVYDNHKDLVRAFNAFYES